MYQYKETCLRSVRSFLREVLSNTWILSQESKGEGQVSLRNAPSYAMGGIKHTPNSLFSSHPGQYVGVIRESRHKVFLIRDLSCGIPFVVI